MPQGGIYGIPGPDGAGKTTTLRMRANCSARRGRAAPATGSAICPRERGLYPGMAREAIAFMRALRGLLRYEGSVSGARSTLPIQTHYMPREDSPGLVKLLPPEAVRDNGGYVFDVPYSGMEALLATLLECGPGVAAGLSLERPSLHHVFVKLVGEETVERMKIEAESGGRMISHFRQAAVIATPAFLVFLLAPLFMLVFALVAG